MTPTPNEVEVVARAIADGIGTPYDDLYENKREWIADFGIRHDVNYPYKSDIRDAAEFAIIALDNHRRSMGND